jgi:hypothetical protein
MSQDIGVALEQALGLLNSHGFARHAVVGWWIVGSRGPAQCFNVDSDVDFIMTVCDGAVIEAFGSSVPFEYVRSQSIDVGVYELSYFRQLVFRHAPWILSLFYFPSPYKSANADLAFAIGGDHVVCNSKLELAVYCKSNTFIITICRC